MELLTISDDSTHENLPDTEVFIVQVPARQAYSKVYFGVMPDATNGKRGATMPSVS
jgi:hypothetical protein